MCAMTSSIFAAIFLLSLILIIATREGGTVVCNDRIEQAKRLKSVCYYVSERPVTWPEAHRSCHQSGGWLMNCIDCARVQHPSMSYVFNTNGLMKFWSGYRVKEHRLIADGFPTSPASEYDANVFHDDFESVPLLNAPWVVNSAGRGQCVSHIYLSEAECITDTTEHGPNFLTESQAHRRSKETRCREFVDCQEEQNFVCLFRAIQSNVRVSTTNNALNGTDEITLFESDQINYQVFLSPVKTTYEDVHHTCNQAIDGATGLSLLTKGEQIIFNNFVNTLRSHYEQQQILRTRRLWVNAKRSSCVTLSLLGYLGKSLNFTFGTERCDIALPALCQIPKVFNETVAPILTAINEKGFNINVINGQVATTGDILLSSQSSNQDTDRLGPLRMQCSVPEFHTGQSITLFRGGIPVQNVVARSGFYTIPLVDTLSGRSIDAIDFVNSFHCEVNDKRTNKLMRSNSIFLTLSDYYIFSGQIVLRRDSKYSEIVWLFYAMALRNRWPVVEPNVEAGAENDGSGNGLSDISTPEQEAKNALNVLAGYVNSYNGWSIKPIAVVAADQKTTLVFYLYRIRSGVSNNQDEASVRLRTLSNITDTLSMAQNLHDVFNVSSFQVLSIDVCFPTTIDESITNRSYALPSLTAGNVWSSALTCARDRSPLVTVMCSGTKTLGYQWAKAVVTPLCDYINTTGTATHVTRKLQRLSHETITSDNVDSVMDNTVTLIHSLMNDMVIVQDIAYIADIVQKVSEVSEMSPNAVKNVLVAVSEINKYPIDIFDQAITVGNIPNRLLRAVDELGVKLKMPGHPTSENRFERIEAEDMALEVWDIGDDYDANHIIGLKLLSDGSTEQLRDDHLVSLYSEEHLQYKRAVAAIFLPRAFIQSHLRSTSGRNRVRLSMNIYDDTTLFQPIAATTDTNYTLNSKVIAAKVIVNNRIISDLAEHDVTTVFLPTTYIPVNVRPDHSVCAYWNFSGSDGGGAWFTGGCQFEKVKDGRDVCTCDHLTNFAVLMSFYDQKVLDDVHNIALGITSIIGLSLSIVGLTLSILSFLLIKKVRQGRPQQTMFNLCLALLLAWVTFLAGIHQTSSHGGCIAVAVLLHYFVLASFMWMLMEGILQYLLFVKVMNTHFSKYMLKTAILAWGIPLIPVIIILAIDKELYKGGDNYCWMLLTAFYYGFAVPVGLIILANIVIFIMVVASLWRRKDMSKYSTQSKSQTLVNIRASFICFCMLGLSWIFGFLAIGDARVVFQYVFCVTASLQGFIVFIMMTARNEKIRQYWKQCCCSWGKKKDGSSILANIAGNDTHF